MAAAASSSSSPSSLAPPAVPMELHAGNRDRLLAALRGHLSASSRPLRGLVLIQGGEEQTRYCTDHLDLFRQESYFAYLFGVREPGFYGAIDTYKVDMVFYVDEIAQVLHDRFIDHGKPLLFLLHGKNTDSGNYSKPASFEGIEKFDTDLSLLHPVLTECRVIKSDMELALIQYANDVSSEAHIEAVLKAHNAVISHMQPGVNWMDMHKLAEQAILESLKKEQIIHGDVADMMARRLGAVFMPHGLGHLLGIDTHDPGGYPQGLERPKEPGLSSLRMIRELKEGMVITVEPGCYFIDALLTQVRDDRISSKFFNWQEVEKYKSFGSVRIESDVYVTAQGCRNLTNCPRETWEIEAVMAGAPWPLPVSSSTATTAENGMSKTS